MNIRLLLIAIAVFAAVSDPVGPRAPTAMQTIKYDDGVLESCKIDPKCAVAPVGEFDSLGQDLRQDPASLAGF